MKSITLDDQVDAQPLVVPDQLITAGPHQGVHDVVYVATEGNTVYAVDTNNGSILLSPNFGTPVSYPLGCGNNGPNVGINSTPVIDRVGKTMYVVIYTNESNGPVYRIHALDLGSLTDTYRSFRAPTLNELYRSFRVGNVQTLANPFLRAEHFTGGEGGVRVTTLRDRMTLYGAGFWGFVTDPVSNVTLSTTPQLIVRMRENLGRIQTPGMQAGVNYTVTNRIWLSCAYQFIDSTVSSFSANPALVGNQVPLVPKNEFVFQGTWAAPQKIFVAIQGRTASNEFDDDQNLLPLGAYFVLSATVSRPLPKGFDVFFQGENLTNDQYDIGRTPVATLGQPILARIGLRWQSRK